MTVLFRVETGPGVGLGHLRRSLSLAGAMKRSGVESCFLAHPDSRGMDRVRRAGWPGQLLDGVEPFGEADAGETIRMAQERKASAVILDYHDIPADYVKRLKGAGLFVAVRDDLALRPLAARVVVNGNADAKQLGYRDWTGVARFFLGPEYTVLPEEFWKPRPRQVRPEISQLLVVLGGADRGGRMPGLLSRLDQIPAPFEITAVLGPYFESAAGLQGVVRRHRFHLLESPESLAPAIAGADLAVSAAGQTLYELACFGCPSVAIPVADNQRGQLKALAEAGCIRQADGAGRLGGLDEVAQEVVRLAEDTAAREAMARAGQALIDGQGACRLAEGILQEVTKG